MKIHKERKIENEKKEKKKWIISSSLTVTLSIIHPFINLINKDLRIILHTLLISSYFPPTSKKKKTETVKFKKTKTVKFKEVQRTYSHPNFRPLP